MVKNAILFVLGTIIFLITVFIILTIIHDCTQHSLPSDTLSSAWYMDRDTFISFGPKYITCYDKGRESKGTYTYQKKTAKLTIELHDSTDGSFQSKLSHATRTDVVCYGDTWEPGTMDLYYQYPGDSESSITLTEYTTGHYNVREGGFNEVTIGTQTCVIHSPFIVYPSKNGIILMSNVQKLADVVGIHWPDFYISVDHVFFP
jgi:hypothetical protein